MTMSLGTLFLWLGLTALFLILNALFVATEYALVKLRRSRVQELVDKGDRAAQTVQGLQREMGTTIAGTQLGITLMSLALGWIGENSIHEVVLMLLRYIPGLTGFEPPGGIAIILSFLVLSMLHVIIGEQVAKSWALRLPEKTALTMAAPLKLFCAFTYPLLWVMNSLAGMVLKLLRLPEQTGEQYAAHSPEEFEILFEASRKAGQLDPTLTDRLQRALDLQELTAKQVMVPRTKMVAIPDSSTLPEVIAAVSKAKKTRLLVYRGNDDNVVGLLNSLDLFELWSEKVRSAPAAGGACGGKDFRLSSYLRQVHLVPESMPAGRVLTEMRAKRTQVAIVLDEFGGTAGVITLKDLVEHLIGDIWDEHDTPNPGVQKVSEDSWRVKGDLTLLEVKKELGTTLECNACITIAGAVIELLGRQPEVGDTVTSDGYKYTVAEMNHRAIAILAVEKIPLPPPEEKPVSDVVPG